MSTTIANPRPAMRSEDAESRRAILASSFEAAWQNIGNAYEQLSVLPAPGNGARTVPAAHDHRASADGAYVAQAQCRWQGLSQVGDANGRATAFPHGVAYLYAWAGLMEVYTTQEVSLVIFGTTGGAGGVDSPGSVAQALALEVNGVNTLYDFETSNDPNSWVITSTFTLAGGTNTAALKINALNADGESWAVVGAEVWCSSNNQMVIPA